MTTPTLTDLPGRIAAATDRLLATADALPDDAWTEPSVCAGWDRAHVLAHVALNAEALGGALQGLLAGDATPMYRSDAVRDADIEELAARPPAVVRDRLRSSAASFAAALAGLPTLPDDAAFDRTPGGRAVPASLVPMLRLREVEIHHADLAAGYSHREWPSETVVAFLDMDAGRHLGEPYTGEATDLGRTWRFGEPGSDDPVVSGPGSALAWLETGRDPGDALTSSTGRLPTVEGR